MALTRRGFLTRASVGAVAGVLGGTMAVGVSRLGETVGIRGMFAGGGHPGPAEPLIAHVRDFSTGEIGLMIGTREVIYRDPDLARHLLRTARQAGGR